MSAGKFPSPGCECCGCVDDGQFVWADRALSGWRGCGWDTGGLPEVFERLYQRAKVTHVKSVYYSDGAGGWTYWKDYTFTFDIEWDKDCDQITYFKAEGSLNGVVQEIITCPEPSTTTMSFDDWVTEEAPDSTPGYDDLPPWPGSYPNGGSDTSVITAVAEDSITFEYTAIDSGGTFFKLVTTIEMFDPLDTDTVRTIVSDMMVQIPLTKGIPVAISGELPDRTEVTGTWGFPTRGADYNHARVFYEVDDCCTKREVIVLNLIASQDDHCRCSLVYTAPNWPMRVFRDRRQSYMPAAFGLSIPGYVGGGAGALVASGATALLIYGWKARWNYDSGLGIFEWDASADPDRFQQYDCAAWGKKGLLSRIDQDDWTVLKTGANENTCLIETPVTKCYRYYYPTDSDTATTNAVNEVFVFDEGAIYREIPDLTVAMDEDCMAPDPGEPDCPSGGDGSDDGIDPNPCL